MAFIYDIIQKPASNQKEKFINYIPCKFTFSITSQCNLRCPTCQYVLKGNSYFSDNECMPFNLYKKIVLQYKENIKMITLTGGEPAMHPDFEKFIDLAISLNINIGVPINGIYIEKRLNALKKISNHISISLDAFDKESFHRYRGGNSKQWNDILKGIRLLHENGIKFNVSFVISRENISDIFRMLEFADVIRPVLVNFQSFNSHSGLPDLVLNKNEIRVSTILSKIIKKNDYRYDIRMPIVFDVDSDYCEYKICDYPWVGVFIDEKGDIAYCCHLAHDKDIGNICEGYNFNSTKIQNWRNMLLNHNLPKDCKFCRTRFLDDETFFSSDKKSWIKHDCQIN